MPGNGRRTGSCARTVAQPAFASAVAVDPRSVLLRGLTMLRLTLRGLWSRKLRTALTFVVVMPGVSLMAGTLVLTDTIRKTFDDLFADVNRGTDVYVRGVTQFESSFGDTQRPRLDDSIVEDIEATDGSPSPSRRSRATARSSTRRPSPPCRSAPLCAHRTRRRRRTERPIGCARSVRRVVYRRDLRVPGCATLAVPRLLQLLGRGADRGLEGLTIPAAPPGTTPSRPA